MSRKRLAGLRKKFAHYYEGAAREDIAILYRSNAQSRASSMMFNAYLPYRASGGGTRFYERQEIKHVMAICV